MLKTIEQTILYFGTPVALISFVEPRWITQPGADVIGMVVGVELHAGLGADGPDVEGIVHDFRPFGKNVNANVLEVHIVKPHVDENLLLGNGPPHIDSVRWRPLIMNFCRFFGLGKEVHPSRLAQSDFMKFVTQGTMCRNRTVHPAHSSGR